MAFTIAGMKIGNSSIDNEEIANISFPTFLILLNYFRVKIMASITLKIFLKFSKTELLALKILI